MPKKSFEALNEAKRGKRMKNHLLTREMQLQVRLRQLDPKIAANRNLDIFLYAIADIGETGVDLIVKA